MVAVQAEVAIISAINHDDELGTAMSTTMQKCTQKEVTYAEETECTHDNPVGKAVDYDGPCEDTKFDIMRTLLHRVCSGLLHAESEGGGSTCQLVGHQTVLFV